MQIRTGIRPMLACAALILAASCTSTSSGTPAPNTSDTVSQNEKALPYAGAPNVDKPLDFEKIKEEPCDTATPLQISAISGGELKGSNKFDAGAGSVDCAWILSEGLGRLTTGVAMENNDGLSSLYDKNTKRQLAKFNPVPSIKGYPAVTFANGGEASTVCNIAVGLTNNRIYLTIVNLGPRNPRAGAPCEVATGLAELAVQHLKET